MNRPIPSNSAASNARKSEDSQQLAPEKNDPEYAQKLKLAQHFHDQGINPERWVEAEPAGWASQKAFRETGRKPDDRHFEIGGRLYKTTAAVAANQAQGQDALDVYLGAAAKPVEQLVDVTKVPLQHPLGRPHAPRTTHGRPDSGDAHALNLHYAKFGIDPGKAHDGDPLPMPIQQRLQQATKAADGSSIPLGIPGIYRGYDDGYFYMANEGTGESPETQQLRRKLATAKAERLGDAAPIASNDNDSEIDEAVARSYSGGVAVKTLVQPSDIKTPSAFRLPILASAIEKKQKGEPLSKDEEALLSAINVAFDDAGVPIDLQKVDVDHLRQIAEAEQAARQGEQPRTTVPNDNVFATATKDNLATPAIMGTAAAVSPAIGAGEFFTSARAAAAAIATLAGEAATGTAALSSAAVAGLVGPFLMLMTSGTQTQEQEDLGLQQAAKQKKMMKPKPAATPEIDKSLSSPNGSNSPSSANDNQPDPANDNDPARGPGIIAGVTASAVTAGLLTGDDKEPANTPQLPAPKTFNPDSEYMPDFQNDFAHAMLQGQLPQIWINGEEITAYNPHGSRGRPAVQELDKRAAEAVQKALEGCRDVQRAGLKGGAEKRTPQFHIGDFDNTGNLNSVRPDFTFEFKHGDFNCLYHLNSVDTNVSGQPTSRENAAEAKLYKNTEKIVRNLAGAMSRGMANAEKIGQSGYVYDYLRKPKTNDASEINEIIEDFMLNVFSCSRITRECRRTSPQTK